MVDYRRLICARKLKRRMRWRELLCIWSTDTRYLSRGSENACDDASDRDAHILRAVSEREPIVCGSSPNDKDKKCHRTSCRLVCRPSHPNVRCQFEYMNEMLLKKEDQSNIFSRFSYGASFVSNRRQPWRSSHAFHCPTRAQCFGEEVQLQPVHIFLAY